MHPRAERAHRRLRRAIAASGAALALTGCALTVGFASDGEPTDPAAAVLAAARGDQAALGVSSVDADRARGNVLSRSAGRPAVDRTKQRLLRERSGGQVTRTRRVAPSDPRDIARALLAESGFSAEQFGCLDALWTRESGWQVSADNPTSSAYGIPQALPGEKMASAGADWATNPATQIRWGLGYIRDRYGSPCAAWAHSESVGWY